MAVNDLVKTTDISNLKIETKTILDKAGITYTWKSSEEVDFLVQSIALQDICNALDEAYDELTKVCNSNNKNGSYQSCSGQNGNYGNYCGNYCYTQG